MIAVLREKLEETLDPVVYIFDEDIKSGATSDVEPALVCVAGIAEFLWE